MTNKRQSSKFETLLSHRILDKSINAINIFFLFFCKAQQFHACFHERPQQNQFPVILMIFYTIINRYFYSTSKKSIKINLLVIENKPI